ncbi:hypothetical protein E0494_00595 [Marinilabiliaceae bacterium JC040]|nr:hypothetical protein [Marinilabiliaceae bacterium JC040]
MKILIITLLTIAIIIILGYAYYGGFTKISPKIEKCGGEKLAYIHMSGDYKNSGKFSNKVYNKLLNEYNIKTFRGFGLYYDNPKKVEKEKLKSDIGCIIESKDTAKIKSINKDLKIMNFPNEEYIVCEFPFKSSISFIISVLKVYPILNKYCLDNNYSEDTPVMEIWDIPNKKIIYRKKIQKK